MNALLALTAPLLLATGLSAQSLHRPVTLGGGLEVGVPFGEFDANWGKQLVGVSADLTLPMGILPFDYGFDFSWARMGSEWEEVPVNEEYLEATTGDLRVRSNVYGYHGLIRLKPFNGKVSPYIEGLAGLRHFTTRTEITIPGMDEPLLEQRNESDFVFSHGWAAGIQFAPTKVFYVEGRVERLKGGQVTYVDASSIQVGPNGQVGYSTLTSGTHVVNVHLGIGLRF